MPKSIDMYKRISEWVNLKFFKHETYKRFAIVGHARTGSNYLISGLNTSKHLYVHSEIFAGHVREIGKDFDLILSNAFQKQEKRIKAVGFKLFYYHLTEEEWHKFLLQKEFMIIHLRRRNYLRTIVSLDIAFKTNQWMSTSDVVQPEIKSVELDTTTLIKRLEEIQNAEILTRERFKDRDMIEIVYEDLVANPYEVFQGIGEFLGVADIDPDKIELTKQNPESLEQLISNYDQVTALLQDTVFSQYLLD